MKNHRSSYDGHSPLLGVAQVAAILGISRSRAFALIRAGEILSLRIGERIYVPRETLLMWIDPTADQNEGYCIE